MTFLGKVIRRFWLPVLFLLPLFLGFFALSDKSIETHSDSARVYIAAPSIMVDGLLYYYNGTTRNVILENEDYSGFVKTVVEETKYPADNDQINRPYKGAPYLKYEDGIVVLLDGYWGYFELRELE
jgi:hypothetical protein